MPVNLNRMITFGQYNTLNALHLTRQCVTFDRLCQQTQFQYIMVRYYIAVLLNSGLIRATHGAQDQDTCYELTEAGVRCLIEYERHNPDLVITRSIDQIRDTDRLDQLMPGKSGDQR